jgi:hypothetical protein
VRTSALFVVCAVSSAAAMAGGYSEKQSGDMSGDRKMPTAVSLDLGANKITGRFGSRTTGSGTETDLDYFKIKIAPGQVLSAIVLGTATDVGVGVSFISLQAGKVMTVPPDTQTPAKLLGWMHFGTGDEGNNILPDIAAGPGAIGFTPPLGAGTYTFWLQELSVCSCRYEFNFKVSSAAE